MLLTVFLFFFFFNQKKAQSQVLAGSVREFFKLPFWGILPSFSVYTAFLFMPFTPPEPVGGAGGEIMPNLKPAYGERCEIESSFVVNTDVLFKNK